MSRRRAIRALALIASTALLGSALVTPVHATPPVDIPSPESVAASQRHALADLEHENVAKPDSTQRVRVLVMLNDQPEEPSTSGESDRIAEQEQLIADWSQRFDLMVDRQFGYLINGLSGDLPENKIVSLALEPQVASVKKERLYYPTEHTARELSGVPAAFEQYGVDGTGTVISIIDTGVDPAHPDLRLDECEDAKIGTINSEPEGNFTCKVPTGYNYADENFVVRDTTASQHGQHVAGIAAANGSVGDTSEFDTTGRIDGAAPNAQVLAMKVFSNDPAISRSAQDGDIIAAIEDSVKMGADIINMSLGSPNGGGDVSEGAYTAIEVAREQGVLTVISAGNEGQNFSTTGGPDDLLGRFDDGAVGNPAAVSKSTLAVASVENSVQTVTVGYLGEGSSRISFGYQQNTGAVDGQAYPVTYMGLGQASDYPDGVDLTGAYALIQRGGITFAEKFSNAIAHGAAGVVVFNHATGGDETFGMAGLDAVTVFGASLGHSDGMALVAALEANPGLQIQFTTDAKTNPSAAGVTPSTFTSWGATGGLEFKPDVAGIGGSVYSTVGDDSYANNSGTSMAAPNVAGLSALLMEAYAQRYPNLTPAERVDLIKTALMNTAQILTDQDGVPYAPRQMGAGLARVDQALKTDVTATVESQASVALQEIDGARSFVVTLTNRGEHSATYTIPQQRVLKESNEAGQSTQSLISNETLAASAPSVTVPAGGTAQVTFTLVPDTSSPHFVEGWAQLSGTNDTPDLAIPYLGFVGDWGAENVIQPPGVQWAPGIGSVEGDTTGLFSGALGDIFRLSDTASSLVMSPNGDSVLDEVVGQVLLMRNASELVYEVLDSDAHVIRELGQDRNVSRLTGENLVATFSGGGSILSVGRSFDGTMWDAQAGQSVTIPDGAYTYRVKARVNADEDWQITDLPFRVDTTAPTVSIQRSTATEVQFTAVDEGSGVFGAPEAVAPGGTRYEAKQQADGSWVATFPEGTPYVVVETLDRGLNLARQISTSRSSALYVALQGKLVDGDTALVGNTATGSLNISGAVTPDIERVTVNGEEMQLVNSVFSEQYSAYAGGDLRLLVNGYNAAGEVVQTREIAITQDTELPLLTLTDGIDAEGRIIVDADGAGRIVGRLADERLEVIVGLEIDGNNVPVATDGTFEYSFTANTEQKALTVYFTDGVNSGGQSLSIAGRTSTDPLLDDLSFTAPSFDNIRCFMPSGRCFVGSDSTAVSADGATLNATGVIVDPVGSIQITPGSRAGADGSMVTGQPIAATITGDRFQLSIPVTTGVNEFRMVVKDLAGVVVMDLSYEIWFDIAPPEIDFTDPSLTGGTLYTNTTDVTFKGTIADDGWGYFLGVNNAAVAEFYQLNNPGANVNRRDFERVFAVRDGDYFSVYSVDAMGNRLVGVIPVVLDQTAPVVGLDTVRAGEVIRDGRQLEAWVNDQNLAGLRVSVDGTVVEQKTTKLSSEAVDVQNVLVANPPATLTGDTADSLAEEPAAQSGEDLTAEPLSAVSGTKTTTSQTRLSATIDTAGLAAGGHTVLLEGVDLAGNETRIETQFFVDATAVIEGPDPLALTVAHGALADQAAVAAQVLGNYTVKDDGSAFAAGETVLTLLAGTVLVPGTQSVTLVATDADGRIEMRSVKLTITEQAAEPGSGGGSGSGSGGSGSDGSGSGGSSGASGSSGTEGAGSGQPRPFLPRTGSEGAGLGLVVVAVVAGAAVLFGARRASRR